MRNAVIAAEFLKSLSSLFKGRSKVDLLLGNSRKARHVAVELFEILRLDYYLIRTAGAKPFIELDSADLDDLTS